MVFLGKAIAEARPAVSWLALMLPVLSVLAAAPGAVQFNRDVRPVLAENCYACHGPDKNQRKAKLRLDVREVALERGAIVPGKPAESKLVQHIFSDDPDETMPPPKTEKTLTTAQKELLKRWIAEGAQYEPHWAYIPLRRPAIPEVSQAGWVQNPIDAFVLHMLEAKNIRPSPLADKRTLLRRLSLDLIGLPPTPAEVAAFLADTTPLAYERQVDRLLASPQFGERMAVPWLDLARFADTVGYHGDQNQNVFPYRDYVIDAFNRNKPFDQFTIEQLAGDLLPDPSVDAYVATGFNRLNMVTREGGAQPKEYLAKYAADRVRTVSMAWLGSTMGCAECHDHKFDPFSTKDFYSMEAFFADLKQWGVYENYGYSPEPELEGIDNDSPFPPEIEVTSPYLQRRLVNLRARTDALYAEAVEKLKRDKPQAKTFAAWRKTSRAFLRQWPTGWMTPPPAVSLRLKDTNAVPEKNFAVQPDGEVLLSELPREATKFTLPLSNMWVSAIRVDIVLQEATPDKAKGKKRKGGSINFSAALQCTETGGETNLAIYFADANYKKERYANGHQVIGVKDSWRISTDHDQAFAVWLLDQPFEANNRDRLVVNLGSAGVKSVRVSISPFAGENPLSAEWGGLGPALKSAFPSSQERALVARAYLWSRQWDRSLAGGARDLLNKIRACHEGRAYTLVSVARSEPRVTRILPRGNWQDETREIVPPATPHFLPQLPNPQGRRLTRLDLAHWLVWTENPLTARAVANRFWKQFFGTGLSAVVDDLGAQGDWPIHPELLDWLACEFREGWDVKHLVKLLVMSNTYRQESNERTDLKEIDPNNRLLAAQSPRRLEAEFVRDNALSIAGLINLDLGGPSAYPYQPAGYYANIQFPDRDYYPDKDERQYRRGLYTHWQRTFLHPMLANFDAPSREECTATRVVSNTPQQGLTLLNDPTFVEAARVLAARVLGSSAPSDSARLDQVFERALARPAHEKEKQSLIKFLAVQREHYQSDTAEAGKLLKVGLAPAPPRVEKAELAAWTQVCRVILNLQETITTY